MNLTTPNGATLSRKPPTTRQLAVLRYILDATAARGMPPTLREIGRHFGIASTNGVNDHLHALERKGLVVRHDMLSRAIRVTREGLVALGLEPTYQVDVCPTCQGAR